VGVTEAQGRGRKRGRERRDPCVCEIRFLLIGFTNWLLDRKWCIGTVFEYRPSNLYGGPLPAPSILYLMSINAQFAFKSLDKSTIAECIRTVRCI